MKFNQVILCAFAAGALMFQSCDETSTGTVETSEGFDDILVEYVDSVVCKTYTNMAENAIGLHHTLAYGSFESFNDETVVGAAMTWKTARQYWEQSEAFLFGPAGYNNLDPKLDSWPLDKETLDQQLAIISDASSQPNIETLDASYINDNYGYTLQGFHAVEYMLFRDGQARSAADFTEAEYVYLKAVVEVLMMDCITLEGWWIGGDALSDYRKTAIGEDVAEGLTCFGDEFKNAGEVGSRYSSQISAIEEMLVGGQGIADEVGNAKIAEPVESGDVLTVESWYSWNSLIDFQNNIVSIENMYATLSAKVAEEDADLDTEMTVAMEDARTKIAAIGTPFRNNLGNTVATDAAIEACDLVNTKLGAVLSALSE